MEALELHSEDKAQLVFKLKAYFQKELDYDLGQFDAEFLIDFFVKHLGAKLYNQGLQEALEHMRTQCEELTFNIGYTLEKDEASL